MAAERLQVGLLWYDGDRKKALAAKVEQAVARYRDKFGHSPDTCYVHEDSMEDELVCGSVRVVGDRQVLPDHFWVGVAGAARQPDAHTAHAKPASRPQRRRQAAKRAD